MSWNPLGMTSFKGDALSSFNTEPPPTIAPSHPDLLSPEAGEKFWKRVAQEGKEGKITAGRGMEMKVTSRFPSQPVPLGHGQHQAG